MPMLHLFQPAWYLTVCVCVLHMCTHTHMMLHRLLARVLSSYPDDLWRLVVQICSFKDNITHINYFSMARHKFGSLVYKHWAKFHLIDIKPSNCEELSWVENHLTSLCGWKPPNIGSCPRTAVNQFLAKSVHVQSLGTTAASPTSSFPVMFAPLM